MSESESSAAASASTSTEEAGKAEQKVNLVRVGLLLQVLFFFSFVWTCPTCSRVLGRSTLCVAAGRGPRDWQRNAQEPVQKVVEAT